MLSEYACEEGLLWCQARPEVVCQRVSHDLTDGRGGAGHTTESKAVQDFAPSNKDRQQRVFCDSATNHVESREELSSQYAWPMPTGAETDLDKVPLGVIEPSTQHARRCLPHGRLSIAEAIADNLLSLSDTQHSRVWQSRSGERAGVDRPSDDWVDVARPSKDVR